MSETLPEFQEWHVQSGDACLLTAGVHHHLSDAAITRTLRGATTLDGAVNDLVAFAARAGATDTITAVLVNA
jgi:serine/threonine protein phosphatase PrpC